MLQRPSVGAGSLAADRDLESTQHPRQRGFKYDQGFVDLIFFSDQGRKETQHIPVHPAFDHQLSAYPGLIDQLLGEFGIRTARFIVLDQFDGQHETGTAHVTDTWVTCLQAQQALAQTLGQ